MSKALESRSILDLVEESELKKQSSVKRTHEYNLDDKAAKAKLLKGAKRIPLELVENTASCNLNFSVGAWNQVVLPSVRYWDSVKGEKTCQAESTVEHCKCGSWKRCWRSACGYQSCILCQQKENCLSFL